MHRVKKAIQKLNHYLGKDKQGVGLLDSVSTIANEMRNELATEQTRVDDAVRSKAAAEGSFRRESQMVEKLLKRLSQMDAELRQREGDIRNLQIETDKLQATIGDMTPEDIYCPENAVDIESTEYARQFLAIFNVLRRRMRRCPTGIRYANVVQSEAELKMGVKEHFGFQVYNMTQIVNDFSGDSLQLLGRFVACRALFNMPVAVQVANAYDHVGNMPEGTQEKLIQWFLNNIDDSERYSRKIRGRFETKL